MATVKMFKVTGGYHNALPHEVKDMEKDGWSIVGEEVEHKPDYDYAIYKDGWKRAVKVCDTEKGAFDYIDERFGSLDGITIKARART